jgi:hypothetical protein
MPEETIEMLGSLIKNKQKTEEKKPPRKQTEKEATGSNAKPLGSKRTEEIRVGEGNRTDNTSIVKSNEPELGVTAKNRKNVGGRKGKIYI